LSSFRVEDFFSFFYFGANASIEKHSDLHRDRFKARNFL